MRSKLIKICLSGILFCLLIPFTGFSQTPVSVNGMVTDAEGEPLDRVTISARNTVHTKLVYNAVTDSSGAFSFASVNPEGKYSFTFTRIGFKEHTITGYTLNEQGVTSIIVKLVRDSTSLQDVVITGFQRIDKRKFTGSVVQVDKELINRSGYMDVSKMLQGTAAGVSVSSPSGTFGATPKIRIRGNASISANQEPLYVLNGVPISAPANVSVSQLYSGDPASLLSSVIAGLNANDIEDISILKDGSATALYGTRAANGIISITTKKGRKGAMSVNLSSALSLGLKPDIAKFNLMDSKQQIDLASDLYNYGYLSVLNYPSSTGAFTDAYFRYAENLISQPQFNKEVNDARYVNTDWFDVLFRNNLMQEQSLSFAGGGEKATYYLSGSYAGDNGASVGYNTKRYTTNMRTIFNLTSRLDLDVDFAMNFRNQLTPGTFNSTVTNGSVTRPFENNPTIYATTTSRAMMPYEANGSYKYYRRNYAPFNILEELNENFSKLYSQGVSIAVRPTYKISNDLTLEVLLSARQNNSKINHVATEYSNVAAAHRADYPDPVRNANPYLFKDPTDPYSIPETILPRGGILNSYRNNGGELYGRASLNYAKKINEDHRINLFGGLEIRSNNYVTNNTIAYGYLYYGGKIISPSQLAMKAAILRDSNYYREEEINERAIGGFFNAQYTFKNRYNIDLMGRADGSNVFGSLTRSRFLPNYNVGVSWNVDREDFFQNMNRSSAIDHLTLRASYALRGNAYQTSPMLNGRFYNAVRLDDVNSEIGLRIVAPELYNLAWEKDYIVNAAIDISFLKRFTVVAEYYSRTNENLIAPSSMPYEEGFASKAINWASMSNKGFDFTFNASNWLNDKKFRWGTTFIYGFVNNKMIDGVLQSPLLTNVTKPEGFGKIGKPLYGLYAYNFAGLDASGQPTFELGNTGRTINNVLLSSTNDSLVSYMGPREPTTTGSFSNTFGYGPLELRIFFTYSYGNKVFRTPMVQRIYADNFAVAQDIDARWRTLGDEAITNVPGLVSNIQAAYLSSAGIQNEFAYNRSNIMVAKADVLRLSEVMLSYDFGPKILHSTGWVKGLRVMASANNIYYWADKKLRGVDPESLITGVALPNPKSYSLRLLAQF